MVEMIVGMMRVKNEARWISAAIVSLAGACERIHVLDDHSTDETPKLCQNFGDRIVLHSSPFEGLDEARDKNYLLDRIRLAETKASWILAIDGDELLSNPREIRASVECGAIDCYSLQVLYLWNRPDLIRLDGVYGHFWRPSLFKLRAGDRFKSTKNGGNFHCGNVPGSFERSAYSRARLMHFGYMDPEDRKRKFYWYNEIDPGNQLEDCYRHMIQGDPGGPAADSKLRHAGPLVLKKLEDYVTKTTQL